MFERFHRKTLAATAAAMFAAMGIGGAAIAQSGNSQPSQSSERPGVESNAPENSAKDRDNVQYTAPGDPDAKQSGKLTASPSGSSKEAPGTEQNPASETPGSESPETPGSESRETPSNSDGPGGHADEPGNPNANHQFQGVE